MSRSRIEDILDVLNEMRNRFSNLGGSTQMGSLRQEAIKVVARRELQSGRFKNRDSAEKSIHDACTRRLRKIENTYNFEHAVKEWLHGIPDKIKNAIEFEIRTNREQSLVSNFFKNTSSIGKESKDETTTVVSRPPTSTPIAFDIEEPTQPERVKQETYRILRDTNLARNVKIENQFQCELCGHSIKLGNGKPYAEAHHIKPLGSPHNGPDIRSNILCVCPNHHVLLDYGAIRLDAEQLQNIKSEYIDYHNTQIFTKE